MRQNQEDGSDGEIKLKEVVFDAFGRSADGKTTEGVKMSVRVETILSGHEDRVTGLRFIEDTGDGIKLLSSSMDKTMILWKATSEIDGKSYLKRCLIKEGLRGSYYFELYVLVFPWKVFTWGHP